MYLKNDGFSGYDRAGQQVRHRGAFLLLLQKRDAAIGPENTFAIVRKVALRQFGHFMMGRVNIGGAWHSVSGAYGSDGLPMTVDSLPSDAVPLPRDLYEAWNKGGGWNGAGAEGEAMRAFGLSLCK